MLSTTKTRINRLFAIGAAGILMGLASSSPLSAQTPAPAAAPAPAAPAAAPAAAAPVAPKLDERVTALEAYLTNSDPSAAFAAYKNKDGALPADNPNFGTAGTSGPGHNAWMMASAALVLFMTLPGLALFYGGLVRKKNVLSVVAQCFGCAGLVTILWVVCGYSLIFADGADGGGALIGNLKYAFLNGVTSAPNTNYSYWVSQNVFSMYQLMFAIITPALIVGAIAERMKFSAIMLFITLWMFAVYFPLAHMIWGANGYMNGVWNATAGIKAIDFAGGTVVHMSSGWSALVLCLMLGKRNGFGKVPMPPHSMVMCAIGTGMLWVGWYGFNAGSAVAADGIAANAFTTTTIATAVACFVWPLLEWIKGGKPSILGFCSGAVAGLVVVTPACGFIDVKGALIIGVAAAVVPYLFCTVVKKIGGYDDALDTFGVHAVGGTMGALLTGFLATNTVNGNLVKSTGADPTAFSPATKNGLADLVANGGLWMEQLKAMGITIVMAVVATVVITLIVKVLVGLRPTVENEEIGLDLTDHGEAGYEF
ncbi:MAG: amtB 1 [Verrucomicrobiaceae bacterium]|nr:amtB 1 [Verrucomicrobiaceae bacterium]